MGNAVQTLAAWSGIRTGQAATLKGQRYSQIPAVMCQILALSAVPSLPSVVSWELCSLTSCVLCLLMVASCFRAMTPSSRASLRLRLESRARLLPKP